MSAQPQTKPALLPLLLFSMVVLALEILLTKILAYSVHMILLYTVLGVAMLGTGAAGSLIAVRRHWIEPERVAVSLAWAALLTCLSLPVCFAIFVRCSPFLYGFNTLVFLIALPMMAPFLCAGVVVTLALTSAGRDIGKCYATNLVGSGLGCFLPVALLGPLDGEQVLGLLTVLSWVAALLYLLRVDPARRRGGLQVACAAALVLSLMSAAFPHQVFPIEPDASDQAGDIDRIASASGIGVEKLFDRWNATGRIEIFSYQLPEETPARYPFLFYAQDSGAGSMLVHWDGRDRSLDFPSAANRGSHVARLCTQWLYGQGYFKKRRKVMIIGLGGGPDLQCALYQRAESVDAVEINPDSIRAVRTVFDGWLGGIGSDERVRFHNRDGRSFAHSSHGAEYDLIQMTGADTKHGLASGALALSENHLYTREAFVDYLESLAPDGVLSIVRFGELDGFRLANTAAAALRDVGQAQPHRNIVVYRQGELAGVVVRRTPFTRNEVRVLEHWMSPPFREGLRIFFYDPFSGLDQPPQLLYAPGTTYHNPFSEFFAQMADGSTDAFASSYPYDISPTNDDRPFFFDSHRYDDADTWTSAPHVLAIRTLLTSTLLLSIILILLPLLGMRERLSGWRGVAIPSYFAAVGLAYMLVEVWMIHRFSMFLGHQTYGLTVVLSSLLIGTGIGAHLGHGFWQEAPQRRARLGVAAILLLLGLGYVCLPAVLEGAGDASIWLRSLTVMAFTVPTGITMGLPFPAGLAWLSERHPGSLAWCVGINGFASVIATIVVIPLSIGFGYTAVLLSGVGLYALAAGITSAMGEPLRAGR